MLTKITYLLLIVLSISTASSIKSFTREWSFKYLSEGKENYTIGKNNRFIYDDTINKPEQIKNCTINYEYFNTDGIVYHKKCRITVVSETTEIKGTGIYYFMVRYHHGKKVIFSYVDHIKENSKEEYMEMKIVHGIMNMETCEFKTYEKRINLKYNSDQLSLLLSMIPTFIRHEDDYYGIFYYNHDLCNYARCRQIINWNGDLDKEIVPYLPKEYSLKNIQMYPTATSNHYFAVATNHKDIKPINETLAHRYDLSLLYATPDGRIEELQHILKNENNIYHVDFSYGYLSACWVNSTKIYCKQFNSEKNKIIDESFETFNEVKTLRITNLKYGGLILLTHEDKQDCEKNSTAYYLRNIEFYGDRSNTVELEDFDLSEDKEWSLTDETNLSNVDGKNVCVSIVLSRIYSDNGLTGCVKKKLLRKCIDIQYLTLAKGFYDSNS